MPAANLFGEPGQRGNEDPGDSWATVGDPAGEEAADEQTGDVVGYQDGDRGERVVFLLGGDNLAQGSESRPAVHRPCRLDRHYPPLPFANRRIHPSPSHHESDIREVTEHISVIT